MSELETKASPLSLLTLFLNPFDYSLLVLELFAKRSTVSLSF